MLFVLLSGGACLALDFTVDLRGHNDSINSVQKSFAVDVKDSDGGANDRKQRTVSIRFLQAATLNDAMKIHALLLNKDGKQAAEFELGTANKSTPFSTTFFYDPGSDLRIVIVLNCTANGLDDAVYMFDPSEEKKTHSKAKQ